MVVFLVFLSKDQEEDPYAIGDSVGIFPKAKVNVIAHDYVEFLADDGRKQVLYLRSDDAPVAGAGVNGINRNIAPTEGEMAVAVASTPTIDTPPPADAHPAARRYVPTTRDVITDDEYGVGLVKYSNSPDGAERYAISEKDLASLQNQSLRLLSEVAPSTAYDENGKPNGIKIDFIGKASLFIKAGLQSGDVILEINGIPVKSIEEATAIYNGFGPNVRFVTVKILRKGAIFNVIFEMDDFPGIPSSK